MNHNTSLKLSSDHLHQMTSDSFLSILTAMKNFNGSMNNTFRPHTNDSRHFASMNFYQFWLHSVYPLYSNYTVNDSMQFLTCSSTQNPTGNVIAMVLYIIVFCVGLFGNTLVIYVVLKFSKMQTVTNRYILNLAIADESFLIGIPFLLTTMYLNEWIFGSFLCKLYMVSTSITQFSSSIFLLIMSADRFIAVCHPISSPRFRTQLVSKIVSLLAWGASAIIMLPIMLYGK
jgi:allatostatin C receptor